MKVCGDAGQDAEIVKFEPVILKKHGLGLKGVGINVLLQAVKGGQ